MSTRLAKTSAPLNSVLANRWSPRSFNPTISISDIELLSALEAARWAPSANNSQPWRFVVAHRGTVQFKYIFDALLGFNQEWAQNAGILLVAIAETKTAEGKHLPHAIYDLGQAVAHLSIQAHNDGLYVHQMSGFDSDAIHRAFKLDETLHVITVAAIGHLDSANKLPTILAERETAPRKRRELNEIVLLNAK